VFLRCGGDVKKRERSIKQLWKALTGFRDQKTTTGGADEGRGGGIGVPRSGLGESTYQGTRCVLEGEGEGEGENSRTCEKEAAGARNTEGGASSDIERKKEGKSANC